MADRTSAKLHKVEVKRRIGRGGMADVYEGVHRSLGHTVALKVLHAHLLEDEEARRRFQAEAKAVAGLRHPNIVRVYDFDLIDGRPFIVMEHLDGPSLADYMHRLHKGGGTLPHNAVVRLISQVAKALDYAHSKGIVHRDVKPANIVLRSPSGRVEPGSMLPDDVSAVLTDFGIARVATSTSATATGTLLGTPAYMAPEQVQGRPVDARTDIYALGVVLYEMLAGRPPFTSDADSNSPAAVLFKHVHEEPPPLVTDPPQLQDVVTRALAKDPVDRYMTAGDFVRDLKRAVGDGFPEPVTMRRRRPDTIKLPRNKRSREKTKRRRYLLWAVGLGALGLLFLVGLFLGWSVMRGNNLLGGEEPSRNPRLMVSADGGGGQATATPTVGNESTEFGASSGGNASAVPGASSTPTPTLTSTSVADGSPAVDTEPTPSPSETPTDTPLPTDTPEPTETPTGTSTRTPTDTPRPTKTPRPTATPTQTPLIDLDIDGAL